MSSRASITGCGVVTALGADLPLTWRALMAGEFICSHARAKFGSAPMGVSRVAALAADAAEQAVARAGWSREQLLEESTAIVLGTSKGDITDWMAVPPSDAPATSWNDGQFGVARVCDQLCDLLGRPAGPRTTLSAACASGLHALIYADLLICSGQVERALVVAAEASIHSLFLASFKRLGVLATDAEPGRPFNVNRGGFRISEAAAAVTLERSTGGSVDITFAAMAGDAGNIVAGDPQSRALHHLLDRAIRLGPVDVIHAHGTGTVLNDRLEAAAMDLSLSGLDNTALYSHKGSLGHSLGASGLISVVLAHTAHHMQMLPPMATTVNPMQLRNLQIHTRATSRRLRNSLVFATGFGGPTAMVKLSSE